MQKKAWPILMLTLSFLPLLPLQTVQAEWNMSKSFKELLSKGNSAQKEEEQEAKKKKIAASRFKDNGNGTLTDISTGLIWLKNANCSVFSKKDTSTKNSRPWQEAKVAAYNLSDGFCGLSDNSKSGDWRLPEREELLEIANHPDGETQETWAAGEAFTDIQSFYYWSATLGDLYPDFAFYVSLAYGMDNYAFQLNSFHVLPVRGKKKSQ
jgi:hypothetical protein